MKRLLPAWLMLAVWACPAQAEHSDIVVRVLDNQLTAYDDIAGESACVFEGALGELSVPGYTNDPGFASEELAPGSLLGYDVGHCGRQGLYFRFRSRVEQTDVRGCGDTVATSRTRAAAPPAKSTQAA